jgi:hypothetical protein
MKSRRQFLKLVAAGSAAALTSGARGAAAAARRAAAKSAARAATADSAHAAPAAIPDAVRVEIEKQKKSTADALKIVRDYPLPAGSPMAFSFAAMRATRREGR